jgi:hypothetical protein
MKSLTIIGRRWFNDREGNTYYSGRALVDGKEVASEKFAYGYGDQYVYELWVKVVAELELDCPEHACGGIEMPWKWCRDRGVAFTYEAADVARKRDL